MASPVITVGRTSIGRAEQGAQRVRSTTERARARLIEWLDQGHVQPGELIPSERSLAELLQLDRGTLRRAIKRTEAEGQLQREGRRLVRGGTVGSIQPAPTPWMKHAIAVLVPNPGTGPARSEWGRYVTLGALDSVRGGGHHVVTLNADALSDADLAPLVAARPKGVLMPELIGEAHLVHQAAAAFHAAGIPVVVYGDDPHLAGYDRVVSDHESGSWILTKALLELGRRPARFWRQPHDVWWLGARSLGYARAMTEAGQRPLGILGYPSIATHHASREGFEDSVRQLAGFLIEALRGPQRVDALMVTSDRDAFYAAAAVRLIGLRPGRDVLIAGYDNYHHLCEERQFQPLTPLLTIDKRNELMGREMLSLLNDRIANASLARPIVRRIPPELVRTGI